MLFVLLSQILLLCLSIFLHHESSIEWSDRFGSWILKGTFYLTRWPRYRFWLFMIYVILHQWYDVMNYLSAVCEVNGYAKYLVMTFGVSSDMRGCSGANYPSLLQALLSDSYSEKKTHTNSNSLSLLYFIWTGWSNIHLNNCSKISWKCTNFWLNFYI